MFATTSLRSLLPVLVLLAAPSAAQVRIDSHGVRAGGTTIDATGVHSHGRDVTRSGITAARDQGIVINTDEQQRRIDCRGGVLTINGNDNQLTVVNCREVNVMGNDNQLSASFVAPGRITVMGNENAVGYTAARAVRVSVSNVGTGSSVTRR